MPEDIPYPERPLRLLLIEDSSIDGELILRQLRRCGFAPQSRRVDNEPDLRRALKESSWDIIITDHKLPTFTASEALALIREMSLNIPTLCVTGSTDPETIKEILDAGACALISKDDMAPLCAAVTSAMHRRASGLESSG